MSEEIVQFTPSEIFESVPQVIDETVEFVEGFTPLPEGPEEQEEIQQPDVAQPQPAQPQTAQPQPAATQPTEPAKEQRPAGGTFQPGLNRSVGFVDTVFDTLAAPGVGLNDFITDQINRIPGVTIPKAQKYENKAIEAVRNISSLILPFILLRRAAGGAAAKLKPTLPATLQRSKVVGALGNMGLDLGVGAAVDVASSVNEVDDNFEAFLQDNWPKTWSFLPSDWRTLDSDSPDMKLAKNAYSGMRFGLVTGVLENSVKFWRAIHGTKNLTKYVFEDESAVSAKGGLLRETDEDLPKDFAEAVAKTDAKREEVLDETGAFNLSVDPEPTTPTLGVHDTLSSGASNVIPADDMGVFAAAVDQFRIKNNIGTAHGRLGAIVTDPTLENFLRATDSPKRELVEATKEKIRNGGKFTVEIPGSVNRTSDEVYKAGEELADILVDPRATPGHLRAILNEFKDEYQKLGGKVKAVGEVADVATLKAIGYYLDKVVDMDVQKASAYLQTSMAGQVSDIAETAAKSTDADTVLRAEEMIMNRVEYLMSESGLAGKLKSQALSIRNLKNLSPKARKAAAKEMVESAEELVVSSKRRAKMTVDQLRQIARERPMFLKPLAEAYRSLDGKVDSMASLNNFVEQSLPAINKAFVDGQPQIPNQIVQGMYSNIYNSVLSAVGTPLKAAAGNAALMFSKPITHFAGAITNPQQLRRGWYAYNAVFDSFVKGAKHMGFTFYKASRDPDSVNYIMREDLVNRNKATMRVLRSYAEASQKYGEDGPMALYNMAQVLDDIGKNPVLRAGVNAMTAADGFTRAVMANVRSRFEAYDEAFAKGLPITGDIDARADELFKEKFDSFGFIDDPATNYISQEIALNLDTPGVKAFTTLIRENPWMRPFLLFPRTQANVVRQFIQHTPVNAFMKDYKKLIQNVPARDFTNKEVEEILTARGITVKDPVTNRAELAGIRAELRGKVALGSLVGLLGFHLWTQGRLHGSGHFDKARQRTRDTLGWPKSAVQDTEGNWHSFEYLGPYGDMLTFMANVMDNFDSITQNDAMTLMQKAAFVLAASITDRSMYAGIEPMLDVVRGDGSAMNRWASGFISSLAPLSGLRNEAGRVISPAYRELDNELGQLIRNRNRFLDPLDPDGALPEAPDWLTGNPIGYSENPFIRFRNGATPFKVREADAAIEERQFLFAIEYDARPVMNATPNGAKYTPAQRAAIRKAMGNDPLLLGGIRQIMNEMPAEQWRDKLKKARGGVLLGLGGKEIPAKDFDRLYSRLDALLLEVKGRAVNRLSDEMKKEIGIADNQALQNATEIKKGLPPKFPLDNI